MKHDRRKESREKTSLPAGIYLSQGSEGMAVSPVFYGQLISLSRRGAGIALHEVMVDRTHLAFGPMENDNLFLTIQLQLNDHEPLIIQAQPIWFDKKAHKTNS